jgi:hypothetical protein
MTLTFLDGSKMRVHSIIMGGCKKVATIIPRIPNIPRKIVIRYIYGAQPHISEANVWIDVYRLAQALELNNLKKDLINIAGSLNTAEIVRMAYDANITEWAGIFIRYADRLAEGTATIYEPVEHNIDVTPIYLGHDCIKLLIGVCGKLRTTSMLCFNLLRYVGMSDEEKQRLLTMISFDWVNPDNVHATMDAIPNHVRWLGLILAARPPATA